MNTKKPKQAKYVKNFVTSEDHAKTLASTKLGVPTKLLEAHHTDKLFVFKVR